MRTPFRFLLPALFAAAAAFSQPPIPQDNWTLDFTFPGVSSNGALNRPYGVAAGAGGSLIVQDAWNSRVQVFDSTGAFVRRFGSRGTANGEFGFISTVESGGAAVAADGKIIVSDQQNYRIQVFNADGSFVRAIGSNGTADGQFKAPWGVATTADGKIVVSDSVLNRIQVFDASGTFIRTIGTGGVPDDQLSGPTGLTIDSTGNIVVADSGKSRVVVFTIAGVFVRQWAYATAVLELAALPDGKIAAADQVANRVVIFNADGSELRRWGSSGTASGQFAGPAGIAVLTDGRIAVADENNHRIQLFDQMGTFLSQVGEYGSAVDGFKTTVNAVEVDSDGRIYAALGALSPSDPEIQVFAANGAPLDRFPLAGTRYRPSLKIGADNRLYVGSPTGITVYERTGTLVRHIGTPGSGDGQFFNGTDIDGYPYYVVAAVDTNGDIYATDPGNARVQVFSSAGAFLRKFAIPDRTSGFDVTGLALTPDGRVAVSNIYTHFYSKMGESLGSILIAPLQELRGAWPDGTLYYGYRGSFSGMSPSVAHGINPRTGAIYDMGSAGMRVWRRGFRTLGAQPPKVVPMPGVLGVSQRPNGYIDIDYIVTDGDSATVSTAMAAFRGGSALLRELVPVASSALVEGTASKLGASVATGTVHRLTWDPSGAGLTSGNLVFEAFARDGRPSLLDMEFVTLPTTPALTISRVPFTNGDLRAAWAWLILNSEPGLSRAGDGEITGPGGAFTTTVNSETRTTAAGRSWLFAKLGVREATTEEVAAAQLATAATTPNRFTTTDSQRMGSRPIEVNEWTIDTYIPPNATERWWVVRLP